MAAIIVCFVQKNAFYPSLNLVERGRTMG